MQRSSESIIKIDGSHGEGGGQILRTSLALSCVLHQPIEIINIRKSRKKPGLQPQHLTGVKALAAVCNAHVEGAVHGSTGLFFWPGTIKGGDYFFDVSETKGSAGSTSLVLQTILLPLCFASEPSNVSLQGGTHVPWSPCYHYVKHVFLPMLSRIGIRADLHLGQWGWYPAGGGNVMLKVRPERTLSALAAMERGKLVRATGISAVANLPRTIAERQRNRAIHMLLQQGIDVTIKIVNAPSPGKGTLLFLLSEFEHSIAGFDSLGAIGKPAEDVANEACRAFSEHMNTEGALDPHLADQVIPYLVFSRETSEFTTSRITQHLLTNIWAVKQFLDIDIQVNGAEGEPGSVRVNAVRP